MSDCTHLILIGKKQAENDELEGKNVFILMYETNSGDLGLKDVLTNHSCIEAKNERKSLRN